MRHFVRIGVKVSHFLFMRMINVPKNDPVPNKNQLPLMYEEKSRLVGANTPARMVSPGCSSTALSHPALFAKLLKQFVKIHKLCSLQKRWEVSFVEGSQSCAYRPRAEGVMFKR